MAGLCAAAEARARGADVVVLEKGDRARRRDAALLRRRLAATPTWRDFRARVPGRRRGAPAARVRAPRRGARLARVARRAGDRARHGQPAHRRRALRHRGADGRARAAPPAARAAARRCASCRRTCRSCSPRAASPPRARWCASTSRPRPTSCCCAPRRGAPATGCGSALGAGRRVERRAWTSSTGATCRRRPRASSERDFVRARAALRAARDGDGPATASATRRRTWSEIDVVQWMARRPGARAFYRVEPDALGAPRARAHGGRAWSPRRARAGADVRQRRRRPSWCRCARRSRRRSAGSRVDARRPRRGRRLGGRRRRGRDRHGRLRERARRGARARPRGAMRWPAARAGDRAVGDASWRDASALRQRASRSASRRSSSSSIRHADALAPVAARVLPRIDAAEGAAGHEAFAAELELRSPPARPSRRRATRWRAAGAPRCAAGRDAARPPALHPAAAFGRGHDARTDLPRYARVKDDMRGLIQRTPECALHVHVGMPDPRDGAARLQRPAPAPAAARRRSRANSPFWFGRDSGLASARCAVVQAYPGRGVPRAFASWDDTRPCARRRRAPAGAEDYTHLWWDVRPHPRLGTVEVREMDAQTRCATSRRSPRSCSASRATRPSAPRRPPRPTRGAALVGVPRRARRDGRRACSTTTARCARARARARACCDRTAPSARELGCAASSSSRWRAWEGGAARQRAAVARGAAPAGLAGRGDGRPARRPAAPGGAAAARAADAAALTRSRCREPAAGGSRSPSAG